MSRTIEQNIIIDRREPGQREGEETSEKTFKVEYRDENGDPQVKTLTGSELGELKKNQDVQIVTLTEVS